MDSTQRNADGHVHLRVTEVAGAAGGTVSWTWARWTTLLAGGAAVVLFAAALSQPWWRFWLYAPQYPHGLQLEVSLHGMGGDVHEIDLLNHYIGMRHLANAAPVERHLAGYGVAFIGIATLSLVAMAGRKLNKVVALPAISFPIVFLADSFYWLFTFGHHLDPKAPLHIGSFTPQLFGNGKIGQFETFAQPAVGFWLAIAGVVLALAATYLRSRICSHCARAGTCNLVCPRALVLPERRAEQAP